MDHNAQKIKRRSHRTRTVVINPREVGLAQEAPPALQQGAITGRPGEDLAVSGAKQTRADVKTGRPVPPRQCGRDATESVISRLGGFAVSSEAPLSQCGGAEGGQSATGRGTQERRLGAPEAELQRPAKNVEDCRKAPEHRDGRGGFVAFERSHDFRELVTAFRSIEKRGSDDCVSGILKKFKTNDERAENIGDDDIKIKLRMDIFPKIQNNPFLKGEIDISMKPIENASRRSSLRRQKRGSLERK